MNAGPDDPARPPSAEAPMLPVTIRSTVPAMHDGTLVLARVDAPTLGIECAYLFLDTRAGALGLLLPCGCQVSQPLSALLLQLAATQAEAHGNHRCSTTH